VDAVLIDAGPLKSDDPPARVSVPTGEHVGLASFVQASTPITLPLAQAGSRGQLMRLYYSGIIGLASAQKPPLSPASLQKPVRSCDSPAQRQVQADAQKANAYQLSVSDRLTHGLERHVTARRVTRLLPDAEPIASDTVVIYCLRPDVYREVV